LELKTIGDPRVIVRVEIELSVGVERVLFDRVKLFEGDSLYLPKTVILLFIKWSIRMLVASILLGFDKLKAYGAYPSG
jgi:hypothetical protein